MTAEDISIIEEVESSNTSLTLVKETEALSTSLTPFVTSKIPLFIDSTEVVVCVRMVSTNIEISFTDFCVWSASLFTSSATTAKPLPSSPARAASIAAFNASNEVFSLISVMILIIFPILRLLSFNSCNLFEVPFILSVIFSISRLT